jgi:hypothetical protein
MHYQTHEAVAFARYLALKTLYIDVWDADSQLHLGTMAVPLRPLLRQKRPVAKVAGEYEVSIHIVMLLVYFINDSLVCTSITHRQLLGALH